MTPDPSLLGNGRHVFRVVKEREGVETGTQAHIAAMQGAVPNEERGSHALAFAQHRFQAGTESRLVGVGLQLFHFRQNGDIVE